MVDTRCDVSYHHVSRDGIYVVLHQEAQVAKRVSEESRVVNFFQNAPFEVARVVMGISAGIMKQRTLAQGQSSPSPAPVKRRKSRKANVRAVEAPAQEVVA